MATDRYAVMGNPIAHSKSPQIHTAFARETGQDLSYEAILVPLDGFQTALGQFQADGGRGLNVTVPFKLEAWTLVDERSPRAEVAQAVNTIVLRGDGSRYGDNTDGVGLVRDLRQNLAVEIRGRNLLLLGAGGAARGVLGPLLAETPERLTIANRTASKAVDLATTFAGLGRVEGQGFDALAGHRFDLVINATAASLHGEVPPLPPGVLAPGACCYDLMYAREPTAFLRWAEAQGAARLADGLGMLVEQAAEAFYLWRAVRPSTAPVIAALRGA